MQIDFHHGVTFLIARLAGFSFAEAQIIAHSAQYVDDATASGVIWFKNGMLYERIASAHRMLDYANMEQLANHRVWLPFHFLPGNDNQPQPAIPPSLTDKEFIRRCVCRPNSAPAKQMMRAVVERKDRSYALYRLGIAAHVFVDTWAHQGFVGFQSRINIASDLSAENDQHHAWSFVERAADFFQKDWDQMQQRFVGAMLPLGHGTVLSYPDRPYLKWSYTNGLGEHIVRDNPKEFYEAATELFQWFSRYRHYSRGAEQVLDTVFAIPEGMRKIEGLLKEIRSENGIDRHAAWMRMLSDGTFGFRDHVTYIDKGKGSWKAMALGTDADIGDNEDDPLPLPHDFHQSHWKLFHDGLQAHRFFVLHELLPRYGILST